tara:strand:- start:27 stop:254 length:228 start_codon:yes stop_codon:yes gene_type:complete
VGHNPVGGDPEFRDTVESGQMAYQSPNKTVEGPQTARRRAVMDWQRIWNMVIISAVFMATITTIIIGGLKWIGAI